MSFDYWSFEMDAVANEIVDPYNNTLSELESRLRESPSGEKRSIRQQIRETKENLRKSISEKIENNNFSALVSFFLDIATAWWLGELPRKDDARVDVYVQLAQKIQVSEPGKIADDLDFRPTFRDLPNSHWLAIQVDFELLTPWYSKDDRIFHVMDNPVRKDRVFGVPFMAASSWKGMLRWSCRIQAGLLKHLEAGKPFEEWKDPDWIISLFGNEKGCDSHYQGALVFYPTWFDRIGFEIINPHSRERRAGTRPIYYEVVPPGAQGTLSLLYAPWPGMKHAVQPREVLSQLLEAIEKLLTTYGISAKRTVGWGTAKIDAWRVFHKDSSIEKPSRTELEETIQSWLPAGGTS